MELDVSYTLTDKLIISFHFTDGGWETTDAMTTDNTEVGITTDRTTLDDITTDIPMSYNDITKGITTSYRDVTTTSFPTTTLEVETASQEIPSTQNLDEVSGNTEGVDLDNVVTTPSTEGPTLGRTTRTRSS